MADEEVDDGPSAEFMAGLRDSMRGLWDTPPQYSRTFSDPRAASEYLRKCGLAWMTNPEWTELMMDAVQTVYHHAPSFFAQNPSVWHGAWQFTLATPTLAFVLYSNGQTAACPRDESKPVIRGDSLFATKILDALRE
jgi:hypothetical protein